MEPITAKTYILAHWDQYNLGVKDQEEMLGLLNILQACGENLDSLHDAVFNGYGMFADIFGGWESDADVVQALYEFNSFFTEKEFIEFILDQINEMEEEGEDYAQTIGEWTNGNVGDCFIERTEDGYVRRLYY